MIQHAHVHACTYNGYRSTTGGNLQVYSYPVRNLSAYTTVHHFTSLGRDISIASKSSWITHSSGCNTTLS